ncbi:MAG: hypothetical protein NTV56_00365 [Alphaproteobacteria bacterium]|nr:hypothetical protein [Alphaproteobacteria bacterium]
MFLVQTGSPEPKNHKGWVVLACLSGAFGAILMMHWNVRPRPPEPPGFRIFGFPRPSRVFKEAALQTNTPLAPTSTLKETKQIAHRLVETEYTADAKSLIEALGWNVAWSECVGDTLVVYTKDQTFSFASEYHMSQWVLGSVVPFYFSKMTSSEAAKDDR